MLQFYINSIIGKANAWQWMTKNACHFTFGSSRIAGDAHERDNAMEVLKFSNIPKNGNDYE